MLLACVERGKTADGYNSTGRLMCVGLFACDKRIHHVKMSASIQADDPL